MTETPMWVTGPGDIWWVPKPKANTSPIRRGTAKRLGLRLPPPNLMYTVTPDLGAWTGALQRTAQSVRFTGITLGPAFGRMVENLDDEAGPR